VALLPRLVWPFLFAVLGLYAAHVLLGFGGDGFGLVIYTALMFAAAAACLVRAAYVRREALAWCAMGIGLLLFAVGDLYWSLALADLEEPPYPSLSDIGWIAWYPFAAASLILLVRERFPRAARVQWLDGAVAGIGVAAFGTALFAGRLVGSSIGDSLAATLTNLAYPIGDLLLIGVCVCGLAVSGWCPGRGWMLICAGVAVGAIADFWYLWQIVQDTYEEGTPVDILWPASTLLIACAAWQPRAQRAPFTGRRVLGVSAVVSLAAVALLVWDHFAALHQLAIWLAACTLVAVVLRTWLTFSDYVDLLQRTSHDAHTDPLTGLPNRRQLMTDLDEALGAAGRRPRALVLIDLNRFKNYNDTFGHAAGDELLRRVAGRLTAAVDEHGGAYRMGGDEFCVIVETGADELPRHIEALSAACSETTDGVHVDAAAGAVMLPTEATTPDVALRIADERMYAQKEPREGAAGSSVRRRSRATHDPYALA
jgi:diguanylate cyclase (GGDEF)-like protein